MTDPAPTSARASAAELRAAVLSARNRLDFATDSLKRLSVDVPSTGESALEGAQNHLDVARRHLQAALAMTPIATVQPPPATGDARPVPYAVRGPQGGFVRYLVHVRVNADLSQRPGSDDLLSHVVWSDDGPYGAISAATAWIKTQGLALRHIFGIVEWPRTPEEMAE